MAGLSIGAAAIWAREFLRREWRLVVPVAFALLALPAILFQLLAPAPPPGYSIYADPALRADPATGRAASLPPWLLPYMLWGVTTQLASFVGALAVTALALVPNTSVAEAIATAARRFPAVLGAHLIFAAALLAAIVAAALVAGLAGAAAGPAGLGLVAAIFSAALVVLSIYGVLRIMLLVPLAIDRGLGPVAMLRGGWELSRGILLKLFGAVVLFLLASAIVSLAVTVTFGSLALLVGNLFDRGDLARVAIAIVAGLTNSVVVAGFYLLLAGIYRQLPEPAGGR